MAYFGFTQKILAGEPIEVYGEGGWRGTSPISTTSSTAWPACWTIPRPPAATSIYNIGDNDPVGLMEMITTLEAAIGREALKNMRPMQPGDVTATFADISKLNALTGYRPKVKLKEGLDRFTDWNRTVYPG